MPVYNIYIYIYIRINVSSRDDDSKQKLALHRFSFFYKKCGVRRIRIERYDFMIYFAHLSLGTPFLFFTLMALVV